MKPRDLTDKRLRELADAADGAGQCSVFAADLRALLEIRRRLVDMRKAADPFREHGRADLEARARLATASGSRLKIDAMDLRGLLAMRRELIERQAEQDRLAKEMAAAEQSSGAREIVSTTSGRRVVLVGREHGKGRANVRTYGFDLAHLAGFLGMHPENVRQAIRTGRLVPTGLASIHAFKLALEARRAQKGKKP